MKKTTHNALWNWWTTKMEVLRVGLTDGATQKELEESARKHNAAELELFRTLTKSAGSGRFTKGGENEY